MSQTGRQDELVVDDREQGLFRVHRSAMTSQQVFDAEREKIFRRCWLYVGHESEVERNGDFVRRTVAGLPVIFVRGGDGTVRALYNTCTHRGATICRQDSGNGKLFQCFYHGWTFDMTGHLVGVPAKDGYGRNFDSEKLGLKSPPRLDQYRGFYFISLDPDIVELKEYLAGAAEYLDLIVDQSSEGMRVVKGSNAYGTQANWKLLIENSMDQYHLATVHKTYIDFTNSLSAAERPQQGLPTGRGRDLGNGHAVMESQSWQPRPIAQWDPMYGEDAREEIEAIRRDLVLRHGEERTQRMANTGRNLFIFPNLVIVDTVAITVRVVEPVAPGRLEVKAWALAPAEEIGTPRLARRLNSYVTFFGPGGFATPDDVEALESCQQGYEAQVGVEWSDISRGMSRSPQSFDELQMRTFWRTWQAMLSGDRLPDRVTEIESPHFAAQ